MLEKREASAVKIITSYHNPKRWTNITDGLDWLSYWTKNIHALRAGFSPAIVQRLDTTVKNCLIGSIYETIDYDQGSKQVADELVQPEYINAPLGYEQLLSYLEHLVHGNSGDPNRALYKWLGAQIYPKSTSDTLREKMLHWEKAFVNTLKLDYRALLHIMHYYALYNNTETWNKFEDYFHPLTPGKKAINTTNLDAFDRLVKSKTAQRAKKVLVSHSVQSSSDLYKSTQGNKSQKPKSELTVKKAAKCWHCNEMGHTRPACPKLKLMDNPKPAFHAADVSEGVMTGNVIYDTGANFHVFNNRNWFTDLTEMVTSVSVVGGEAVSRGRGTVTVPIVLADGEIIRLQLTNCWYVPGEQTLISHRQLLRETCSSISTHSDNEFKMELTMTLKSNEMRTHAFDLFAGSSGCPSFRIHDVPECNQGLGDHEITKTTLSYCCITDEDIAAFSALTDDAHSSIDFPNTDSELNGIASPSKKPISTSSKVLRWH